MATLAGMSEAAPVLLALDTSTETMAVALRGPLGVRLHEGEGGAQASASLLPTIQALLREQGLRAADLSAVAFGCGPGAFTGLRTACAVAQGLALGAGCPVVPVDSLMLVAEDTAEHPGPPTEPTEPTEPTAPAPPPTGALAAVAMDARMGELYASLYRWRGAALAPAGWEVALPPGLYEPQVLAEVWRAQLEAAAGGCWVAGSGLALLPPGALPAGTPTRPGRSRAGALLRLAERLLAAGAAADPAQALPVYLRDKVALTVAERAVASAASAAAR
jgi:tRNA threonylcarbamoyladenosine biosynthesis protein TsaB